MLFIKLFGIAIEGHFHHWDILINAYFFQGVVLVPQMNWLKSAAQAFFFFFSSLYNCD